MAKAVSDELFTEELEVVLDDRPYIHNMIRSIARTGIPVGDTKTVFDVDADVGAWVANGYELFNTHYLGEDQTGWMVLYILVRKEV